VGGYGGPSTAVPYDAATPPRGYAPVSGYSSTAAGVPRTAASVPPEPFDERDPLAVPGEPLGAPAPSAGAVPPREYPEDVDRLDDPYRPSSGDTR
jgi:hypothetical protein